MPGCQVGTLSLPAPLLPLSLPLSLTPVTLQVYDHYGRCKTMKPCEAKAKGGRCIFIDLGANWCVCVCNRVKVCRHGRAVCVNACEIARRAVACLPTNPPPLPPIQLVSGNSYKLLRSKGMVGADWVVYLWEVSQPQTNACFDTSSAGGFGWIEHQNCLVYTKVKHIMTCDKTNNRDGKRMRRPQANPQLVRLYLKDLKRDSDLDGYNVQVRRGL